jgi:quercetin dioxygenase-like cupin family protein
MLGAGFLEFGVFKNILDKNPWISNVELSNWGEIFLNNKLIEFLKYSHSHDVDLHASNGVNLNDVDKDVLEALVKYRFRNITCSIDGASQETYSIYRRKGDFNKVLDNVKTINKFKAKYNSQYPTLDWQFIAFGHNEHEISKARKMAGDLNMVFRLKLSWEDLYTDAFSPIKNAELIRKETGLGVTNRDEYRKKYRNEYARDCCLNLWINPQINYDGRVLGCCVNYWDDYGNVLNDGLIKCFNNEKINYAREMLFGKRESKIEIPCSKCKFYYNMGKYEQWITNEDINNKCFQTSSFNMLENNMFGYKIKKQLDRVFSAVERRLRRENFTLSKSTTPRLTSRVYPLRVPLPPDEEKGWKPYPIFKGPTKGMHELSCHVSVLIKGHCPHPPHAHKEEELLLLLTGEVDIIFQGAQTFDGNQWRRLQPGQFAYYPSGFAHTLQTTSEDPANYLMFKWHAESKKNDSALAFGLFDTFDATNNPEVEQGFSTRLLFEGSTDCLRKLHCHTSALAPGAGYDPHIDDYDVAIVILEGEVETLDERVGPHGVINYAAGEPHGIRNPMEAKARYVVFEFHGR